MASSELPIRLKITRPATIAADTYHDFMTRMIAIKIAKKSPTPGMIEANDMKVSPGSPAMKK